MEFATLGKGYEAWCTGVNEAIRSKCAIEEVRGNFIKMGMDKITWVQRYCDSTYTGKKVTLSDGGPHLPIMQVDSDVHPL